MATTASTRPADAFSALATALDWEPDFGLCFVFSDDELGTGWLRDRLAEHVRYDPEAKTHNTFRLIATARNAGDFTGVISARMGNERNVVWAMLPHDPVEGHSYARRLNEQRQRLITSGHFFIIEAPHSFAHEMPAWAPDLWSVRTLVFQMQSRVGIPLSSSIEVRWGNAQPAPVNRPLSPSIDLWQRAYTTWKAQPTERQPSTQMALRASQDALHLRRFDLALQLAEQALEVAPHDTDRARALGALARFQHRLGQVDAARDLYTQAIALYEKEQNDLGRANTLKALGDLQSRLGQVDAARDLYTQAIALYEKEQNYLGRANTLQALGDLQRRLGQVDAARDLYTQAIALYEKEQNDLGLAYSWAMLANTLPDAPEQPPNARHAREKALHHAQRTNTPNVLQQIQRMLAPETTASAP